MGSYELLKIFGHLYFSQGIFFFKVQSLQCSLFILWYYDIQYNEWTNCCFGVNEERAMGVCKTKSVKTKMDSCFSIYLHWFQPSGSKQVSASMQTKLFYVSNMSGYSLIMSSFCGIGFLVCYTSGNEIFTLNYLLCNLNATLFI